MDKDSQKYRILVVEDNPGGVVQDIPSGSFGLNSMKSRVKDVAGDFQVISTVKKGTKMEVRLPIS